MKTPDQYAAEADRYLRAAEGNPSDVAAVAMRAAQVNATLALAAVLAEGGE